MAVELASAYISLIPSARGIHNQIASELKGPLNRVASDAGDSSSRAFSSRFGAGIKNSTANIARTAAVAFGGVGIALGALGGFGLKAAGDFQQTRIAFEGILGSAEKAQSFLQKLRDFAAKTPFEFPELADAAKSLLAVGFSADDVIPVMTRLGNVAATLGVGGEAINGVVRALGQMKGKGKASAEELNQISEQIPGFSAIKAIAESLGITTAEAMKKMATGAISADVAVEGILKGMEKFPGAAGAMARQSKTLNGVISTFKDSVRDALINGLEPLLPTLSSIVERAAPIIGKLVGVAAKGLASFILTIKNLGAQAADAFQVGFGGRSIAGISGWVAIVAKVGAALRGFIDFIKGDVASAGVQLGKIFGLQEDSKVVQGFIDALGAIRDAFVAVIGFIQRNWKPVLLTAAAALLVFTAPMVAVVAGLVALYFRFALVRNAVALFSTAIGGIVKFLKENQTVTRILAIALGTLAAAFGALLIVGKVQAAFALFKTTLSGLGAALATNPIVLAAVALGLLAGALVVAYQHSKAFRDFIDQNFLPVFRNVTDFFKNIDWAAAFDSVSSAIKTVFAKVQDIDFASIFGRVKDVFQPVISALVPLGNAIVKLAIASIPVLVDAFAKTRTALTPVVVALYIVARVAGVVLGAALRVLAAAVSFLADHLTVLKPVLFAVAGGFAAFKLLKAVETGILGVARVAGTAFGTFQRLQGNLGRFFTTVAQGPAKLRGLAVGLRTGALSFAQWGKAALISAVNTVKQIAAMVAQKVAALAAATAQKVLTAAQWLLNAAMSANPIVLVVAAIAALAAGVFLAYKNFKPFRDAVDAAWQILQKTFDWVKSHWPLLVGILVAPIGLAVLLVVKNFDKIKGFVSRAFNFIKRTWPLLLAILVAPVSLAVLVITKNFDKVKGFTTGVLNFVKSHWPQILAILTGPFGLAALAIFRNFDKIKDFLGGIVTYIRSNWPQILAILTGPFGLAALAIGRNIDRIRGLITHVWDGLTAGVTAAKNWVGARITDIVGFVTRLPGRIAAVFVTLWNGLKTSIQLARDFVGARINEVVGFVSGLPARILAFVGSVAAAGLAIGSAILNGIKNGLSGAAGFVSDIGRGIANAAIGFINTIIDGLNNAFEFKVKGPGPLPDFSINPPDIPHIPQLATGGVFKTSTLAIVGENARTTPEIVSPVRLMADTFRQVLESTTINTSIDTNETSITADAARATKTVQGYLIELGKMPATVTTRLVADTKQAVSGFDNLVSAVSVSADPFEHVSSQFRELNTATASVERRFKDSTQTIRQVAITASHLTSSVADVEPLTPPDTSQATSAIQDYVTALHDIPTGVVTRLVADTQKAVGGFSDFVSAVSVSLDPFQRASTEIREVSHETSSVDRQFKESSRSIRQVVDTVSSLVEVTTAQPVSAPDTTAATRAVQDYVSAFREIPTDVATRLVADTRQAAAGFSEFVGAVTVSANPFERASTQIREISSETSSIQRRFKESTQTIRNVVAEASTLTASVTQADTVVAPDTSDATSAIQQYVTALRDIPTGVVTRLVTDTQDAAVAVSDFVTAVSISPVPFEHASVHIRDISRETSTVDEQLKRSTRTIRDVVNTSTDLTTVLSTPPTQPSFTVPTAAEVAAPDAVKASSAVRDYVVELAKIPTSVVTKLLVDSDRAKVAGTDQFEAFVRTVLPAKNVLSVANQFTTATSTVDKASTSFVHSLEQFPKTVLNVQRPEPVKPQTESGKFDLTVKPTAPIVTPAAQLAATFQTDLKTSEPKSFVGVAKQEIHVDRQSVVEEIGVLNKRLGMRVAIAGRR